jgi:glutathione S-transferase
MINFLKRRRFFMSQLTDPIHQQKRPTLHTVTNSPFGLKVHGFLTYKGIPFENIYCKASDISKQIPVGNQIPVLTVNGESKADSTPIGIWLDELYPDRPRLLPEEPKIRDKILRIDEWVTKELITLRFRASRFLDSGEPWSAIKRGWILGELLNHTAPGGIDPLKKFLWPLVYQLMPFISHMVRDADLSEPIAYARERICKEFIERLEGGLYFANQDTPSLADFAAYPALVAQYLCGFPKADFFLKHPELVSWAKRMEKHLQGGQSMVPPRMICRSLPS